jgi:UDP-N-acetylglucosamine--N-acetylmuramyl-(pentapeptide) pyrophosphoryl-undecaprenol N-acetylglucosamine transferase
VTIVFAGGGTGGHLYPAIAIAGAMGERGARAQFVGSADRLEATIVPACGYPLHAIASRPFARRLSLDIVRTLAANVTGTVQSLRLLARLRPDAVIATGGYVCFPVVLAARLLRAVRLFGGPIALLEPNARPGLTNRLLSPLVDEVWGAVDTANLSKKFVQTGVPIRAALSALPSREEALTRFGLSAQRKTLFAMGGSQGARSLNDALIALFAGGCFPDGWQLLLATGERDYERVRSAIASPDAAVVAYVSDVAAAYAAADLVLARAGASTLGELSAVGKPAVLVPYPHATDAHQEANAARFVATGAAVAVPDRDLAAGRLEDVLAGVTAPQRLAQMQTAAARLAASDPLTIIAARVDALVQRRKDRA